MLRKQGRPAWQDHQFLIGIQEAKTVNLSQIRPCVAISFDSSSAAAPLCETCWLAAGASKPVQQLAL